MTGKIYEINSRILEVLISDKNSAKLYDKFKALTKLERSKAYRLELVNVGKTIIEAIGAWDISDKLELVMKLNNEKYVEARFISYCMLCEDLELFKSLSKNKIIHLKKNINTIYFGDFYAKSILLQAFRLELIDSNFIIDLAAGKKNIDKRIALVALEKIFLSEKNKERHLSSIIRVLSLTKKSEHLHVADSHHSLKTKVNKYVRDN